MGGDSPRAVLEIQHFNEKVRLQRQKKSQKGEKKVDFYQFSHCSTICYLTSRRQTYFPWQPEPLEIP